MVLDRASGDFGSRLRAARERRGVSLRQIATATKISVSALEALERNDLSRLPGGIFSRAFVRSYAAEVGLDPDETIQEFLAQFPHEPGAAAHAAPQPAEDHDAVESERRTASTFLRLIAFSVPIAAAVVYFSTSGRPPPPPLDAPVAESTPPPRPAAIAPPRVATPPAAVAPRAATPQPETVVSRPPRPAATSTVSAQRPASDEAPLGERLTVGLLVVRPCWLSATVDGEKKIERLLQPGERQTIEVARELSFTAGDASAVKMTINGADARPLGKEGEVVTARISLANFKSYLSQR